MALEEAGVACRKTNASNDHNRRLRSVKANLLMPNRWFRHKADAFEQFATTLEVVVEAATGDLQFFGQGIDPHSVDAAGNQDFLCRMNPIFPREVSA